MQLVGNKGAYAVQSADGSWTPVRERITPAVLLAHLRGEVTVGTYVLDGDKARTLVFDIDETNIEQANDIESALVDVGVPDRSIATEYSGRKGYHVWVLLSQPVPAQELRRLGKTVVVMAGVDCEVFPKQDRATDLGNLVKLPGGIHQVTGNRCDFFGRRPQPMSAKEVWPRVLAKLPKAAEVSSAGPPPALNCMACIQEGVDEGGRNRSLFHMAAMLRRSGLAEEFIADVLTEVAGRCTPAVSEAEVQSILSSSRTSGPICSQLPAELQCEDCPILRPRNRLQLKSGQLRHGGDGELVVVQLGRKGFKDSVRELEHPDIARGQISLQ